jgi:hypothetical protein
MGAGRLQQIADILRVSVPFFFEGAIGGAYKLDGSAPSPAYVDEFVSSEDGMKLIKAFIRIARPAVRQRVVALVNEIAARTSEMP